MFRSVFTLDSSLWGISRIPSFLCARMSTIPTLLNRSNFKSHREDLDTLGIVLEITTRHSDAFNTRNEYPLRSMS